MLQEKNNMCLYIFVLSRYYDETIFYIKIYSCKNIQVAIYLSRPNKKSLIKIIWKIKQLNIKKCSERKLKCFFFGLSVDDLVWPCISRTFLIFLTTNFNTLKLLPRKATNC